MKAPLVPDPSSRDTIVISFDVSKSLPLSALLLSVLPSALLSDDDPPHPTAIVAAIAAISATAINFLNFIILKSSVLCVFVFSFLHGLYHIKWL